MSDETDNLLNKIDELVNVAANLDAVATEAACYEVLKPLFRLSGYSLVTSDFDDSFGHQLPLDFIAIPTDERSQVSGTIGLEHRKFNGPVGSKAIRTFARTMRGSSFDRLGFISLSSFTPDAADAARTEAGVPIELFDIERLRAWAKTGLEGRHEDDVSTFDGAISRFRVAYIRSIIPILAQAEHRLGEVEWREMEHVIGQICKDIGLGEVEVTRSAKDGGKDVILRIRGAEQEDKFLIEIKHWTEPNRVGSREVQSFVEVLGKEDATGGLILASSGYTKNAFEAISSIKQFKLHLGDGAKIVSMCRHYVRHSAGLLLSDMSTQDLLFDGTVEVSVANTELSQ